MPLFKELRIMKDHWHYRAIKRTRPWTIHTECIHNDAIWKAAKDYVNSGKSSIWFVVTPTNYNFVNVESGVKMNKDKWESTILDRYRWLHNHGQEIQLHIHLRVKMHLYLSQDEAEQDARKKILEGAGWLRKNGFNPTKVVFGWWSFDDHVVRLARSKGLEPVNRLDYYFIHDYDLV